MCWFFVTPVLLMVSVGDWVVTELVIWILKRFSHEDLGLNAEALCIKMGYGCASEANYMLSMLSDTFRSSLGPLYERLNLQINC